MKLNINTSETVQINGQTNRLKAKSLLTMDTRNGMNDFAMQILEVKAVLFALAVTDDMPEQGLNLLSGGERLVNILEKDFDALHRAVIDATTTYTTVPAPAGTEAQALLNLLLNMLKMWRRQEVSGNEFEEWLEQCVSLASSLNLNPVTGIKGGDV